MERPERSGKNNDLSGGEMFQKAMLGVPFPLMIYAEDGEILLLSKVWTDISGYSIQDVQTVDDWLKKAMGARNGTTIAYVDKVHSSGNRVEDGDYIVTARNGDRRTWYFNSAPLGSLPDGRRVVLSIATDVTERKLAEKALQETVWLMHMIIYRTGDGVTISDASGHFEVYNSRMQEITGYSIEEANSSGDFSKLIYPERKDRAAALDRLNDIIKGEVVEQAETVIRAKDGSKKTLLVMSSMIRYKNREMFLSIYRDITERKLDEEKIAIFQKFAANSGQGFGMADLEGNITYANAALGRIFDEDDPKDILDKNIRRYYPKEHIDFLEQAILPSVLKGGQWTGESVIVSSKGRRVPVIENIFLIRDEKGSPHFFANVITDISERKTVEERLKESEERLRAIFENSIDGMVIANVETLELLTCNSMMTKMLGYDTAEIRKLKVADIHPPESMPVVLKEFENLLNKNTTVAENIPVKRKDGSIFYADITAAPMEISGKRYAAGFFRDTTERKKSDEALKEAYDAASRANEELKQLYKTLEAKNAELQKLDRIKNDFISTVSHEIRTPLSITKEGIDLVLEGIAGPLNVKQLDILSTARNNINRLARIISDLLDVSKMEAGRLHVRKTEIDLIKVAQHVVILFGQKAKEKGLRVETQYPPGSVVLMADGDMIVQVLTNLLDNAIKFTNEGHVGIQIRDRGYTIECTVYDSGIGIAKEDIPKIFNKFEQIKRTAGAGGKGTGLGLFIVKGIIEAHGGSVWADSVYGKGTSFSFVLPKR